jgi:hypothetical protein
VGIAVVAIITQYGFSHLDTPLLIGTRTLALASTPSRRSLIRVCCVVLCTTTGSFGATAVLIYGAQQSPLAQPKNVLGGHGIAALVGVTCYKAMGSEWCDGPLKLGPHCMILPYSPFLRTVGIHAHWPSHLRSRSCCSPPRHIHRLALLR